MDALDDVYFLRAVESLGKKFTYNYVLHVRALWDPKLLIIILSL